MFYRDCIEWTGTILSIPLGPRDVRTASLIADWTYEKEYLVNGWPAHLLLLPNWIIVILSACPEQTDESLLDIECDILPTLSLKEVLEFAPREAGAADRPDMKET